MRRFAFGAIVLIALILTACGRDEAGEPTSAPTTPVASPTDVPSDSTPVGPSTVRTEDDDEAGETASPQRGEVADAASPQQQDGDSVVASPQSTKELVESQVEASPPAEDAGTAEAVASEAVDDPAVTEPSPSGAGTAKATTIPQETVTATVVPTATSERSDTASPSVLVSPTAIPSSPDAVDATPIPEVDATPSPLAVAPEGVPEGAERAQVEETVDGDTIVVRLDGRLVTVDFMGADAPEEAEDGGEGDCYAAEATDRVSDLLGPGRVVWLELPEEVSLTDEPASRYVWVVNADGEPYMINRSMVRHGFALVATEESDDQSLNLRRLADAEDDAAADGSGMWTACGLLEATAEAAAAVITTCAAFGSFGDAQTYYASRPDAQSFIDPNFDGQACEFWFGVAAPPSGGGTGGPAPAPAPGSAPAPSGQGRDGADGASGQDGNQGRSSDSVGEPGDDSNVGG